MPYVDRIFLPYENEQEKILTIIKEGAKTAMTDTQIIALEISDFMVSSVRKSMLTGESYYRNLTEIQNKRRVMSDGTELVYRKNTKLEHAFYRKNVDQITGYMFTKPASIKPVEENESYSDSINEVLGRNFWKVFTRASRCAVNQGITWLQPFINFDGELRFMYVAGYEVIPLWSDNAHTELEAVIRTYDVIAYEGQKKKVITKAEYWTTEGVQYFVYEGQRMALDVQMTEERGNSHFHMGDVPFNWTRIPFIPIKYNDIEQPLIDVLKSNIDTYNYQSSVHADLLADIPLSLVAVKGYGGDPDRILYDIFQSRVAMLHHDGGIEIVHAEPQTESVETMLSRIRRDIFSFGAGVDGQDEGQDNKSGQALQHKRADLDTICNNFEIELQESMEQIVWFSNQYLLMIGAGDFTDVEIAVTFNRDIVVQESDAINDCKNSIGIISNRTIVSNHPWVEDVDQEMSQLEDQQAEEQALFEQQTKVTMDAKNSSAE